MVRKPRSLSLRKRKRTFKGNFVSRLGAFTAARRNTVTDDDRRTRRRNEYLSRLRTRRQDEMRERRERRESMIREGVSNALEQITDRDNTPVSEVEKYNYRAGFDTLNYPIMNVNYESDTSSQRMYRDFFEELDGLYERVGASGRNWQFVSIVIQKIGDKYFFIPYVPYYVALSEANNAIMPLMPGMYNQLRTKINNHITNIVSNANLGKHIKEYLDNGEFIHISLDYYVARDLGQAGFHIDTRRGNSVYTHLIYNNDRDILGPELASFSEECAYGPDDQPVSVFRPVVHFPYGSAGFNDNVIIHSTPYSNDAEYERGLFTDFQNASILPSVVELKKIRKIAEKNGVSIEKAAEDYGYNLFGFRFGPATVKSVQLPLLVPSPSRASIPNKDLGIKIGDRYVRPSFIRCHMTHHTKFGEVEALFGDPNQNRYIMEHRLADFSELPSEMLGEVTENRVVDVMVTEEMSVVEINELLKGSCIRRENRG